LASLAERVKPREFLARSGPLWGLVILCVVMTILSPYFLTFNNLFNVGTQIAVIAILALGQTFVIVSGGIDLSVGSVLGLAGIVFGWATAVANLPLPLALALGVGAGASAGLINGLLITLGNLPPFIATLAMLSAARGLALVISGGVPLNPIPGPILSLGSGDLFGFVPLPVILMLVMWAITVGILRSTYAGRAMYAIGGNEEASRLSGINVSRQKLLIYTLSGLFAGIAGVLLTARLASAQPQAGFTFELDAIAAVVIGGASLSGGVGSASGTLIGALILGVLRNGLNLLNVSAFWQQVVIGAVIALAVMTDTLRRRKS
jgi:ribose/xylose/arabinose/galactoside ABC-type transport system permease subunit